MRFVREGVPWAGLAAGPTAWALSTQANYAIVPWPAFTPATVVPLVALALLLVALAGGFLSWRAWRTADREAALVSEANGRPREFLAAIGALSGVLFAVVIALQGTAAFMVEA